MNLQLFISQLNNSNKKKNTRSYFILTTSFFLVVFLTTMNNKIIYKDTIFIFHIIRNAMQGIWNTIYGRLILQQPRNKKWDFGFEIANGSFRQVVNWGETFLFEDVQHYKIVQRWMNRLSYPAYWLLSWVIEIRHEIIDKNNLNVPIATFRKKRNLKNQSVNFI